MRDAALHGLSFARKLETLDYRTVFAPRSGLLLRGDKLDYSLRESRLVASHVTSHSEPRRCTLHTLQRLLAEIVLSVNKAGRVLGRARSEVALRNSISRSHPPHNISINHFGCFSDPSLIVPSLKS